MSYADPFQLALARKSLAAGGTTDPVVDVEQAVPIDELEQLSPDTKDSLLAELGRRTGQFVEGIGTALDTPGAIIRGVLANKPLSGFSSDTNDRVTGQDLLEHFNLKPSNPYLAAGSGFVANIVTDPLSYLTGPLMAGGVAANAARKAGLMQYAPLVAQLKHGAETTQTGKFTANALKNLDLSLSTAHPNASLQARPLIGPRLAQSATTLEEVVNAAPDANEAIQNVQLALGSVPYESVKNQRLGGGIGWQTLFGGQRGLFSQKSGVMDSLSPEFLSGSQKFADRLDKIGQQIGWSAPVRKIAQYTDQRVYGPASDELSQILALRAWDSKLHEQRLMQAAFTKHAEKLTSLKIPAGIASSTGVSDLLNSKLGNDAVLRIVENHPNQADLTLVAGVPGLTSWADDWQRIAAGLHEDAKELGMTSSVLSDKKGFGTRFSPRSAQELDIIGRGNSGSSAQYSASIRNQLKRSEDLKTPGATFDLRSLSTDPRIRQYMKLTDADVVAGRGETDAAIGQYIKDKFAHPEVDLDQSIEIARTMRRLKPSTPDDYAVFSTHPLVNQGNYMMGEAKRVGNVKSVYEALGDTAKLGLYTNQPGGKHMSLGVALSRVGGVIGLAKTKKGFPTKAARDQVRQAILNASNAPPGAVDLSDVKLAQYSVPESVVNRLTAMNDFATKPATQSAVKSGMDQYTTLFKGFVLAWPATKVRDSYSNLFSAFLETNDIAGSVSGFYNANGIVMGEWGRAMPYLRSIPRYQSVANDPVALKRAVIQDVGGHGVLSGLTSTDLLSSSQRGDVSQFVPGSTPISVKKGLSNLWPTGENSLKQMVQDFGTIRGVGGSDVTKNPLLMASQEVGDTVDSIGRLGTFLALLKNNVAPEEAARRVKSSLVDYSSLTPWERNWARSIFPWYAYQSRMGKYVAQHLIQNPGGAYGKTIRFSHDMQQSDKDTYVPSALKQQFAIRIPQLSTPTNTAFLSDIDLPGFDILNNIKYQSNDNLATAAQQSLMQTARGLAFQMHPLVRHTAELLSNTDAYSGLPLNQAQTPIKKMMQKAGLGAYYNPLLNMAIQAAPGLQRPVSLAGELINADDEVSVRDRLLKAFVNNTSGVKLKMVNEQTQRSDQIRKLEDELSPYSRERSNRYVPKDERQYLSKGNKQKLQLKNTLEREAVRQRKKAADDKKKKSV